MNRTARKIIIVAAASVFLFSGVMFLKQYMELRAGEKYSEELSEMALVLQEESSEQEYVDVIQVDFDLLRVQNPDVIAWMYCPNTPINYPIVQTTDNAFYLNHLLDGSKNSAGTLFMDYRNTEDLSDWNSVIYGHNMKNNSMFGTLTDYKEQSYFEAHPVIYLLTPEQNYRINVLSGFVTSANAEIYSAFDPDDEEKELLMKRWMDASDFASEIVPDMESHFVTLSTCSYEYDDAKYVLVGVLETF